MIRACETHGYFEGEACPQCGRSVRGVLDSEQRVRLSKFLSGALRHFPRDVGLSLDDRGWADYEALVGAATDRYRWATSDQVAAVVELDPEGRFERDGGRIRAAYGHSVDVALEPSEGSVPDRLYHGTAPENLDAIRQDGLRPMGRQQVHLSGTREAARAVGQRHATNPVVVTVDASGLQAAGRSVDRRGEDTYTVDRVPPEYLSVPDSG